MDKKLKILLWKPGVYDMTRGELPTIGLSILATSAINAGHEAVVADHHFSPPPEDKAEEAILDLLDEHKPDILGISAVSYEWTMPRVQAALNAAKERNIQVWLGGPQAVAYSDKLVEDDRLTKIVIGEADGRFNKILEAEEKIIHLGRSPSFDRPTFTAMIDHEELTTYPLFVSRGCHYNCTFCAATKVFGNRWRARELSPELWDEIDQIAVNHPKCKTISIIDDAFTQDMDHAKNFLKEYLRRGYPYQVSVFNVRADYLDEEILLLLKKTGVETLAVGIESADPEVFRMLRKGEKLETIETAIRLIQKAGLVPWLNMVIGLPGDNIEAHRRSLDWVLQFDQPRVIQWNIFSPFRGTMAYDYFVKTGDIEDGFTPPFWGRYEQLPDDGMFDAADFSREEKSLAQLEAFLKCNVPIIILSDKKVRALCKEHGMWDLYEEWRKNAPIKEFLENTVPNKVEKGQESISQEDYNSLMAEFVNDNQYPTDPFVYKTVSP
ncbi:B12-binding domain-containing radical SAM protein [Kordiimonas laminariae]|uniref:B12-binding domain-containing radical SAM protein n=1 Tax=Kordiimonas laminariae TaxID=2917717 RepID=UPI001FF2C3DD|nr:radical SAM protein [Kordiimonas laminariae]MCK0069480.1 B12-binding domain-containing radical SAM protein [Kordiimonas laminariae]